MSRVGDGPSRSASRSRASDCTPSRSTPTSTTPNSTPAPAPTPTARPAASASQFAESAYVGTKHVSNGAQVPAAVANISTRTPAGLGVALNRVGVAGSVGATAISVYEAARDISAARANPNQSTVSQAVASGLSVPRNVAATAGAVFTAHNARVYRDAHRAAQSAFRAAAPQASQRAMSAAARAAASTSVDALQQGLRTGASRPISRAATRAVETAVDTAVRNQGVLRQTMGTTARNTARAVLRNTADDVARAATRTAVRSGAGAMGRAAARFAPGVNVAVAAMDVGIAASTLANPEASTTAKVTSVITAAGSIAAATNIPVVSQVGAAVSVVSSFVGGLFG